MKLLQIYPLIHFTVFIFSLSIVSWGLSENNSKTDFLPAEKTISSMADKMQIIENEEELKNENNLFQAPGEEARKNKLTDQNKNQHRHILPIVKIACG